MPANPGKTTATEGAWVTADGRSGDDCPPESHVHGSCRFQELAEGISGSAGGPTQGPGSHGASENAEGPPSRAALPCSWLRALRDRRLLLLGRRSVAEAEVGVGPEDQRLRLGV